MPATIAYAYVGALDHHTDPGQYDPSVFYYLDGASGTDAWAQPTRWAGSADNSVSEVVPQLPAGWLYVLDEQARNLHCLESSRMEWTTNPSGRLGGMLRLDQGDSTSNRTLGLARGENRYLSGEIQIATRFSSTAEVCLYGAPDATADGTQLWSHEVVGNARILWQDLDITGNPYFYLQVNYAESGNTQGYPVQMDNLLLLPTVDVLGNQYPGYFDGSTAGGGWDGTPGGSTSTYYGGSRRCLAEVIEAIDMSSMAGGTRAEFTVGLVIPGAFWEDFIETTATVSLGNDSLVFGQVVSIDQLAGGTAPIDDALVTLQVTGALSNLTITDMATGGWLKISGTLPTAGTIVIDNEAFTVKNGATSLIASVTRGGSNTMLPLTPVSAAAAPALRFAATGTGSLTGTIVARRRYVIG